MGKSHHARVLAGKSVYLKPQSKWWDGYEGQETVILDDLDFGGLCHYLKIWSDKWACPGEVKGGTVPLLYKKFIVTSNYTPEQLFTEKEEDAPAVRRRFKFINMLVPFK